MGNTRVIGSIVCSTLALGLGVPRQALARQDDVIGARGEVVRAPGTESREAIDGEFARGLATLERQRLERLDRLAAGQEKAEANKTLEAYFHFAIAAKLFTEAEPTAERVLKAGNSSPQVLALAALMNIIAEASRGAYQESLDSLDMVVSAGGPEADEAAKARASLPIASRISLVDAYYQRLLQGDQFEFARKAMRLIGDHAASPVIKELAAVRLRQLDLIGKPAPPIVGTDVDQQPVRLADSKGDVVLIVFWASWCVPNSQEVASFKQVVAAYRDKGFRVLGVNLDAMQEDGQAVETALPNVRRFLIDHNVQWPNVIDRPGDQSITRAYGVTEIPANVLVGRDGTVLHLDLTGENIEKVVARAVAR